MVKLRMGELRMGELRMIMNLQVLFTDLFPGL
jgi:hypothetical protein